MQKAVLFPEKAGGRRHSQYKSGPVFCPEASPEMQDTAFDNLPETHPIPDSKTVCIHADDRVPAQILVLPAVFPVLLQFSPSRFLPDLFPLAPSGHHAHSSQLHQALSLFRSRTTPPSAPGRNPQISHLLPPDIRSSARPGRCHLPPVLSGYSSHTGRTAFAPPDGNLPAAQPPHSCKKIRLRFNFPVIRCHSNFLIPVLFHIIKTKPQTFLQFQNF